METPYETEREAALAKALLEIGGECIGTTSPGEYARMALDEVYPGRAEGSTMPALKVMVAGHTAVLPVKSIERTPPGTERRVDIEGMSLADEAKVPREQQCRAGWQRRGVECTRPKGHPGQHMADYGDVVTSWPQEAKT